MAGEFNSSQFKRLQTFLRSPFPKDVDFSVSPMKLAEAGFVRPERPVSDEVECPCCGLQYSGWSNESPIAVHRILRPDCPFLRTPPTSCNEKFLQSECRKNSNELEKTTEKQFPAFESSSRISSICVIEHPFSPKGGDFKLLYESFRLLTFQGIYTPLSKYSVFYAQAGFAYNIASKRVFCVFCNIELDFVPLSLSRLEEIHAEKFPLCPFTLCYDVGNISMVLEKKVHEKIENGLKRFNDNKVNYFIKHPEFEDKESRFGTFSSWPRMLTLVFPADEMANCGFYYTGFNDKVKCYACGVGLYDWPPNAVPIEQHAKASPHCFFLKESKGPEFVNTAQNIELIVQADMEEIISSSPEQDTALLVTESSLLSSQSPVPMKMSPESSPALSKPHRSSPGSPVLDMEAIKAATACGHYPNQDLLLGILKAADENKKNICEKTQEIIYTKTELQVAKAEKAVFQAEKTLFQAKEAHFRAKEAQFEAQKAAYQQEIQLRSREVQRDLIVQQHRQDLERKDQILKDKDHILEQKDQTIKQNCLELELKTKELEDIQRHFKSLQAALENKQRSEKCDYKESALSPCMEHSSSNSDPLADEFPVASCKVCLVKRSQVMFLPCKHLCCCDTCAVQLMLQRQSCPICREPNKGMEKVYVI